MAKNESRFTEEVVPKVGRYKGKTILVSKRQKKRLLLLGRVSLPRKEQKGTGEVKPRLEKKTDKGAEERKDK